MPESVVTSSEEQTIAFAARWANSLKRGDVVALYGDLGSGKTQFVKGVCRAFGVHEHVTSPSFIILNRYAGQEEDKNELLIYHLDLYRVKSIDEIYDIGYEEILYGDGICLIEWAEVLGELLPSRRVDVRLSFGESEQIRLIEISRIDLSAGLAEAAVGNIHASESLPKA